MSFCLEPNSQQEPAAQSSPPLWGLLVYILLTETLNIDDEVLMEELDLPVPLEDVSSTQRSGRKGTTNEEIYSGKLAKVRKSLLFSGTRR